MARSKNGEAIGSWRRTRPERRRLQALLRQSEKRGDLKTWRRARAVLGYLRGKPVITMAKELDVTRGSINRWLQWFEAEGTDGVRARKSPGPAPRLTNAQLVTLVTLVDAGPQAAGYDTGLWTGPMIADCIRREFGVSYHNHYVPRLLHQLGFSVQRPRKRLARADAEKQQYWLRKRLPAIKKKQPRAEE